MPKPKTIDKASKKATKTVLAAIDPIKVINKYDITYYNNDMYFVNSDNSWERLAYKNEKHTNAVINKLIRETIGPDIGWYKPCSIETMLGDVMVDHHIKEMFRGIAFKDRFFNHLGVRTTDRKFTTTQIPHNYASTLNDDNSTINKYLDGVSGGDRKKRKGLIQLIAASLSNIQFEIFAVLYSDDGETGKSTFAKMIANFVGASNSASVGSEELVGRNQSQFALRGIKDTTLVYLEELPRDISYHGGERIKMITNTNKIQYESKGSNESMIDSTMTWIASTNHIPLFTNLDDALKSRLLFIKFAKPDLTNEEWLELNTSSTVLLPIMDEIIKEFKGLVKSGKTRVAKFSGNDINDVIEQQLENDPLTQFVNDNEKALLGKSSTEMYALYLNRRIGNPQLPRLQSGVPITKKLREMGWIEKRTSAGRTYWKDEPKEEFDKMIDELGLEISND